MTARWMAGRKNTGQGQGRARTHPEASLEGAESSVPTGEAK